MGDLTAQSPFQVNEGLLLIDFYQPVLSYNIQEEIDPVQWTVLLGNIGGVWEIILVIWGVLLVAARVEDPNLKARNLRKSVRRARERAARQVARLSSMSAASSGGSCRCCSSVSFSVVTQQPDAESPPAPKVLPLSGVQHVASPRSLDVSIEEDHEADGKWELGGGMSRGREMGGAVSVSEGSAGGDMLRRQHSSRDLTRSTSASQVTCGKQAT